MIVNDAESTTGWVCVPVLACGRAASDGVEPVIGDLKYADAERSTRPSASRNSSRAPSGLGSDSRFVPMERTSNASLKSL